MSFASPWRIGTPYAVWQTTSPHCIEIYEETVEA
jgi:hypothetical protein